MRFLSSSDMALLARAANSQARRRAHQFESSAYRVVKSVATSSKLSPSRWGSPILLWLVEFDADCAEDKG